jgi:phosphomannomutase
MPDQRIFRAYDIRGQVGKSLHIADMEKIGTAFASQIRQQLSSQNPRVIVMRDGRISSPDMARAICSGLQSCGAQVIDGGIGPTPLAYFARHQLSAEGCVMITGSHNPKDYNGVKLMIGKKTLHSTGIMALYARIQSGQMLAGNGHYETRDFAADYMAYLTGHIANFSVQHAIIWDAGNGAAGDIITALTGKITAAQHILLHCTIDGHFPNHHPDPSNVKNLQDIIAQTKKTPDAIGFAFDGDGDRLGVVDELGRPLNPDHLLMLFSRDILARHHGATMIADVKTSDAVFADITAHGGQAIMWKTGHALIKEKLQQTRAAFAGEASGHVFFADDYFGYDDAIYAALRLLRIVANSQKRLCDLVDALPILYTSPEWRISCADDHKFAVIEALAAQLSQQNLRVNTLDGVRVSNEDGWWLLRASNTQAALVARVEGHDENALARGIKALASALAPHGLCLPKNV